MAHCNIILSQILKFVPRHEFESHCQMASFKTRLSSSLPLRTIRINDDGSVNGRSSWRDIVDNMSAQLHRLYHLGNAKLSRSNLSRINEDKPYALYEAFFGKLSTRCQGLAPVHAFNSNIPCIL